jgi:NAD(P)-dependent dehydrogenase (short-subunit alcohol dehydrogenase family)
MRGRNYSLRRTLHAGGIVGDDLYDKVLISHVDTRRVGRPEEIAQTIVFLCSDEASYISGTTLTPDGGFTYDLTWIISRHQSCSWVFEGGKLDENACII